MKTLTKVTTDNLYENINEYVDKHKIIIENYDGMVTTVLRMIKNGYCFTMDRDVLRDAMETLTYMYAPDDDMNKDRVMQQFAEEEEEEDDDEEEPDLFNNAEMMKMMQMMSGGELPFGGDDEVTVKKENASEETQCPETGEQCQQECIDGECKSRAEVEQTVADEDNSGESLVPEKTD